ncbi:MAG: type II secretion system protein [Gorillibacterium sp.]|nr:type II secretion system protein [Gorillibacterium sp.]
MRNNKRGVTLVEALAVLVITGIVLGGILFLMNQTNNSVTQLTNRENAMRDSRTILNHIANSVRRENASATQSGTEKLILSYGDAGANGTMTYTFDSANHRLSFTQISGTGTVTNVLSEKVSDVFIGINGDRIAVTITMLVNNKEIPTSTVVYLPSL